MPIKIIEDNSLWDLENIVNDFLKEHHATYNVKNVTLSSYITSARMAIYDNMYVATIFYE